jgi:hypothetical protein
MKKIKINKLPKGFVRNADGSITQMMETGGQPTLNASPRSAANLEAEKGETVVTDLDDNMIPEHYKIGGKKHSQGGTPLNLPAKSFIFSDHKSMAIGGEALKKFIPGSSKKKMTPAQIASLKKFDMSEENAILKDSDSDLLQKETAERNIQSKLVKLGELAMEQESLKDFENGIPNIALPYLNRNGITPEQVQMINAEMEQRDMMQEMARYGKETYQTGGQPPLGEFTSTYEDFENLINSEDFNPLLDQLYSVYKEKYPDSKSTKEQYQKSLLEFQKQNFKFKDSGVNIDDEWDRYRSGPKNKAYKETAKSLSLTPMSDEEIKMAQDAAINWSGLADLPEFASNPLARRLKIQTAGPDRALSNVDALYGDNTAQTFMYLAPEEPVTPVEPKEAPAPGEPEYIQSEPQAIGPYPEDLINIAAIAGRRIPREYGYTQRLQPFLPDPTFLDPERELQANQEVGAINAQAMALQGRGQNLAGNLSALQGKLAASQANTLGRYANANSQIANSFEVASTEAMNKFQEYNALQNRQQRIDTAVVNQGYANAKNQQLEDYSEAFNRMSDNRRNTAMLNDFYENYSVNPFTGEAILKPGAIPQGDAFDQYINAEQNAQAGMPQTKASTKKPVARYGGEKFKRDLLRKFTKK